MVMLIIHFTMKSIRMQIPRFIIQPILFLSSKGFPKNGKCFRYLNKIVKISFPYMTPIKDLIAEYWTWGDGMLMSFLRKNGYKNVTCIDLFCKKLYVQ